MNDNEFKCELLPEDYLNYDLTFKLIVIGESGVGKSCLTTKATKNIFEKDHQNTVGFEFATFNLKLNNKIIKLQIWDTCGQEVYRSLVTGFYRNSSLAIIVYSIDNAESLETADNWLRDLRNYSNPDIKIFLIGNKVDLENDRKVKTESALKFKEVNQIDLFMETSAKTGFNTKALESSYEDRGSKYKGRSVKTLIVDNKNNRNGCC